MCPRMLEHIARAYRMHRCTHVRIGRAGRSAAAGTHSCRSRSVYAHKYSAGRHTGTIFAVHGSMSLGARLCMHACMHMHQSTDICMRGIHMHTDTRKPTDEPAWYQMQTPHNALKGHMAAGFRRRFASDHGFDRWFIGRGVAFALCHHALPLVCQHSPVCLRRICVSVSVCLQRRARAHERIIFRNQEAAKGARVGP